MENTEEQPNQFLYKRKNSSFLENEALSKANAGGGDQDGQNQLQPLPSVQSQDISMNSFNEIVGVNEEGHPFIDINRLTYQPREPGRLAGRISQKERPSWYIPDFTFIASNLVSLFVSVYFFLMGLTTLQFKTSLSMFNTPNCQALLHMEEKANEKGADYAKLLKRKLEEFFYIPCTSLVYSSELKKATEGYNFTKAGEYPIIRTTLANPEYLGLLLLGLQIVNFLNVTIGVVAAVRGYSPILIQHIVVDCCKVLAEFCVCIIIATTGYCEQRDLAVVRVILAHYIKWYGTNVLAPELQQDKQKILNAQIDSLQIGLSCCGVDSWADYMAAGYPFYNAPQLKRHLDSSEAVIPYSCCRRWWIRNIYCSMEAHLWASPLAQASQAQQFQERIVQEGCAYKLERFCESLLELLGIGGLIALFCHAILLTIEAYVVFVIVKTMKKLIADQERARKRKEIMHEPGGGSSDVELSIASKTYPYPNTLKDQPGHSSSWSKVAPPTEDEIVTIKLRSNFNKFVAVMKYGKIGAQMETARKTVMEGQAEGFELEPQTEVERKAREKELVKARKDPQEDHKRRRTSMMKDKAARRKTPTDDQKRQTMGPLAKQHVEFTENKSRRLGRAIQHDETDAEKEREMGDDHGRKQSTYGGTVISDKEDGGGGAEPAKVRKSRKKSRKLTAVANDTEANAEPGEGTRRKSKGKKSTAVEPPHDTKDESGKHAKRRRKKRSASQKEEVVEHSPIAEHSGAAHVEVETTKRHENEEPGTEPELESPKRRRRRRKTIRVPRPVWRNVYK